MVAQHIATRLIMDILKETVRTPGVWVAKTRWGQEGMDLSGAREAAAASGGDGESEEK